MTADPALRARAAAAAAARAERLARADPWPAAVLEAREVFRRPLTPPELIADPVRRDRVLELLALNEGLHRAGQDGRIREGALELANERLRAERDTLREEIAAFRRELVASIERPVAIEGNTPPAPAVVAPPPEPNPARPPIEPRRLFEPASPPRGRPVIKASAAALAIMSRPPPDPIGVAEERRMAEESHEA
jgi:hypothetical protein